MPSLKDFDLAGHLLFALQYCTPSATISVQYDKSHYAFLYKWVYKEYYATYFVHIIELNSYVDNIDSLAQFISSSWAHSMANKIVDQIFKNYR